MQQMESATVSHVRANVQFTDPLQAQNSGLRGDAKS